MVDETRPTIEIVAERGREYRPGESVTGELHLSAPSDSPQLPVDLLIEREHVGSTILLRQIYDAATTQPGEHVERFTFRFPEDAFNHESHGRPVKTWLVARTRGQQNVTARWRLFSTDLSIARPGESVFKDFREIDHGINLPPALLVGLVAMLGFLGYAFSFALSVVILAGLLGLFGVLLIAFLWEDSSADAAALEHLHQVDLELSQNLKGSSLLATLTLTTGENPGIESVTFDWWGREYYRATTSDKWLHNDIVARQDRVAETLNLGPETRYEFSSSFQLPPNAPPSVETVTDSIRWGVDVRFTFADTPAQTLTAKFDVGLEEYVFDSNLDAEVVASERADADTDSATPEDMDATAHARARKTSV